MTNRSGYSFSRREKLFILMVASLLLLYCGWTFAFSPLLKTVAVLRETQTALAQEQNRLLEKQQQLQTLITDQEGLQLHREQLNRHIPSLEQMPRVLEALESLLHSSSLSVLSLKTGIAEREQQYTGLEVIIHVAGEESETLLLLESLERFEHLLLITGLDWLPEEAGQATLELTGRFIFYNPATANDTGEKEVY